MAQGWHNKHIGTQLGVALLGFVLIVMVLLVFYLTRQQNNQSHESTAYGVGTSCHDDHGNAGICGDRATTGCPTYYDSGNHCPGGRYIQCCVNKQTACNTPEGTGQCHNTESPNGYNNYSCNGHFNPGNHCPGPQDVQCCVSK